MSLQASWIHQGFFKGLSKQEAPVMPAIRDELCRKLGLPRGHLRIFKYPSGPKFKYLYWWRERDTDYAEAQFFAEVSKTHPVLSLGLSIEKGYDDHARDPKPRMDRPSWDWSRFVKHLDLVLSADVVAAAKALGGPVNLRVLSKGGDSKGWQTRAFSFVDGRWLERHVGPVKAQVVSECIRDIDAGLDSWAIVHFASDLGPKETGKLSASRAAAILVDFDVIRRRIHR